MDNGPLDRQYKIVHIFILTKPVIKAGWFLARHVKTMYVDRDRVNVRNNVIVT